MKIIKRIVVMSLIFVLSVNMTGCNTKPVDNTINNKLNIVTTVFPYYSITKAIIGDAEGIGLELAVKPGQDTHSFEPTPNEIIKMEQADLFIYNGGGIETWVDEVLDSFNNDEQTIVKMMDEATDINFQCSVGHEHGEDEEHGRFHDEIDPHIWTSPVNAMIIAKVICNNLCEVMPEQSKVFKLNTEKYLDELETIDKNIREIVNKSDTHELIFADQFPLIYFTTEYDLHYHSAFSGCGHDVEPSVQDICKLIDIVKEKNIKAVFHLELSSEKVADTICEDTGAIKLQFNSCHNVSQKQFNEGVTYLELMRQNVVNLRKALN